MATTSRFYYDATISIALTIVVALVVAFIAAVIVGGNKPSFSVAIIVFALTGATLLFRWWRAGTGRCLVSERFVAPQRLTRWGVKIIG